MFGVGLQGISMDNVDVIESTIKETFANVVETGFDADRIEAILHRTELSLKKQVRSSVCQFIFKLEGSGYGTALEHTPVKQNS